MYHSQLKHEDIFLLWQHCEESKIVKCGMFSMKMCLIQINPRAEHQNLPQCSQAVSAEVLDNANTTDN